ncbi:hypothetical protein EDB92DRAFT_399966 [Lactarius akahatsu]|uniref:Uncharacterized protein n=1 Tax=Lactarius akahatsu TaxID=416441 RepID=A0AAD4QEQ9_9AGAM|nr:hypothetical protein EDB92DRAFT_399966 [Lactarius akahatsu]
MGALWGALRRTTEIVKGPVAVLEPAMQRAPPQLKFFDPLLRMGSSKPQSMHNSLPFNLLDFSLMTAVPLVIPSEEQMNLMCTSPSDSFLDDGVLPTCPWGYYLQTASLLPVPSHLEPPTWQPSNTLQSLLWRSIDGVRASQPALKMTTIHVMRRALMAAQQVRHRPERQAVFHPTPIITWQCNTQHIRPDKGYTRRIRVRRCRLRLMPRLLPGNRIEELASCHDYRLLKDTAIPVGRLRRRHTDESHRTNHHRSHRSLPQRTLPYRTDPRL